MRVTKKDLEVLVTKLNQAYNSKVGFTFTLDLATCYGGYCLTTDNGSCHATARMSNQKMFWYLTGALDFISSSR